MPRRTDLHRILVIGSGPILIGQAAEFDYAGTQACLALKEEGYEVILVNSNPATIMTDRDVADKVYIEPITLEFVSSILRRERPDAIVPTLGGQTGLNMATELAKSGIPDELGIELLGSRPSRKPKIVIFSSSSWMSWVSRFRPPRSFTPLMRRSRLGTPLGTRSSSVPHTPSVALAVVCAAMRPNSYVSSGRG